MLIEWVIKDGLDGKIRGVILVAILKTGQKSKWQQYIEALRGDPRVSVMTKSKPNVRKTLEKHNHEERTT